MLRFCYTKRVEKPKRAIGKSSSYWSIEKPVKVYFITSDIEVENKCKEVLFEISKRTKLDFEITTDRSESDIRIDAVSGIGSWSYVGTDALFIQKNQPTLNIGWREDGKSTVYHELFGHAMGLLHEHQHPDRPYVFDKKTIYKELAESPNFWDRETVDHNIIDQHEHDRDIEVFPFNIRSIMHYPSFPEHWYIGEAPPFIDNQEPHSSDWDAMEKVYGVRNTEPIKENCSELLKEIFTRKFKFRVFSKPQLKAISKTLNLPKRESRREIVNELYKYFNL